MHAECSRMHAECSRMHAECSRMHAEYSRMHAKCSRIFQNACRMFQNVPECMQICELKCSHISLHAVTKAFMQLCKLAFSFISLHAVSLTCMQFHELVCSSFLCLSSSQEFRSACFHLNLHRNLHVTPTFIPSHPNLLWGKRNGTGHSLIYVCIDYGAFFLKLE